MSAPSCDLRGIAPAASRRGEAIDSRSDRGVLDPEQLHSWCNGGNGDGR